MADKNQMQDVSVLSLRAALKTANLEKRTVDVTWTTGAPVLRRDFDGQFYEELSLDPSHVRMQRLNNGAPFLADHNSYSVRSTLGVVEPGSAKLIGSEGVATIRFASAEIDPEADVVFRKIQDGIIQNVSVGYRVMKFEKQQGGDAKVPTYRATDWEPYEISAVAMGADDGAGFRNFALRGITRMTPEEQKAADEAKRQADLTRQAELKEETEKAIKVDRERSSTIRTLVKRHGLGDELSESLIKSDASLDQARAQILEKLADRSDEVQIDGHQPAEVGEEQRDKSMRGAEAALMQRFGMSDLPRRVLAKASERGGNAARPEVAAAFKQVESDPGEFGGMRMARIAQELLERAGKSTRRLSDKQIIEKALEVRSGQNTDSDFSVLLANLMYKTSLGQYALADDTWRRFCGTDTVQDFRPSNRYRLGTFGVLDVMPESAEYKNASIPDGLKFSITVQTYGKMLSISRQALIDDDMGAVLSTAGEFGRAAALTMEKEVYALINANSGLGPTQSDSSPFFDSSRGNVNGTGSAISVDALEADRVQLSKQTDISSNEYLALRPAVLLVPVGLEGKAKVINRMEYDGSTNTFQIPNKVLGLFRDIVGSPRLTDTTRRYLFVDPGDVATIKMAFLNGQQAPFLEQRLGWRVDGLEWKLRIDFKAQMFDPKGALTNAGA